MVPNTPLNRILVINPNSSQTMTTGLDDIISSMSGHEHVQITTYTAPSGPASINNQEDCDISARIVMQDLESQLHKWDFFLVACYSVHPLVSMLRQRLDTSRNVMGIFEASVNYSVLHTKQHYKFGIVTTGQYWVDNLTKGVLAHLFAKTPENFKGVESTGLNADELHTADQQEVEKRVKDATKRLIKDNDCSVICLGCAGMAGMEHWVRDAIEEEHSAANVEFDRAKLTRRLGTKTILIADGFRLGLEYLSQIASQTNA